MSTKPQELKKIIDNLRQIIVGKVAMPPDQIEQITLFLFLKQLSKKHDDLVRAKSKEIIFTGAYDRYHFDVLLRHSGEELVKECREAVESLYKNPNIDTIVRRVFEKSYLKILDPKVLAAFLSYLNKQFSDSMDLGDFYESLLPILGTQNELGQFRTPRHIIDFIVRVADPAIGEKICDPACGTSGFLVASFNYLKRKYTDRGGLPTEASAKEGRLRLNPEQVKKLYTDTIYGWDMEPLMVKFSLANLYLHGLKNPNVSENDTLLNENLWQHTFGVIMANPPFITPKGGARRHSRFAITSNKTEVLFCEWMVHHLNFNGRLGMIVPEGIIFDRSRGHQAIRKLFLDSGLWCVMSLPSAVFQPYSGVKTSIVFVDKSLKPKEILFVNIKNHGFSLNTNPAPIEANDLPTALEIIKKYKAALKGSKPFAINNDAKQLAHLVAKEKIEASGDYNLTGERYRETEIRKNQKWPMVELGKICSFEYGKPLKEENRKGGPYPVFGSNGIVGYHDKYLVKGPFIIVGRKGTAGAVVYSEQNGFPIDTTFYVRLKDENKTDLKFLYFVLRTLKLDKINNQAGVPGLNRNDAYKIKIPLPPIEVQKEIVEQIEVKQNAINHAKEIIKNLERERRYFGQSLRKVEGVEWAKLGEVCDVLDSKRKPVTKADRTQGKYPYYGATGIVDYVDDYIFDEKLVLIGEDGAKWGVGEKTAFTAEGKYWVNNHAHVLRPDRNKILDEVLAAYINSIDLMPYITGITVPKLNQEKMRSIKIPLLRLETQKQLVTEMEEQEKIIEANKNLVGIMEQKITEVLSEI